ncbi:MAG: D-2-hydroxyacid dehydrogenase [Anaerolineae bacterium]|nr:D-2-hydroxyacid dehydrogenase [Anaerolineae bacterium]MDW8173495.1 D-2-hydroxyacid dehydrogenase [Anaerolineae bacterium]
MQDTYNVVVSMDFTDALMERLRAISPRLNVVRYFPRVDDSAWAEADIAYTLFNFPTPEQAPRLRWIQLHTAGMDYALDKPIIQHEAVTVTSTSGIHARQIANYCLMMMLAHNFQLPRMLRDQAQAHWPDKQHRLYAPIPMHQQTLGIAGYGTIGRELARVAQALGMRVLASKRDPRKPAESAQEYTPPGTGDPEGNIPERIYPSEALASMAAECDYLVVTVPLTPSTRHLVGEKVLRAMKPTAQLINIARGELVDTEALLKALHEGWIGGAALDVYEQEPLPADHPLWRAPNVIMSPHVSGNSVGYHELCVEVFSENLRRFLDQRPLLNVLNKQVGY